MEPQGSARRVRPPYLTVVYNDTAAGPGLGDLFQTAHEIDPYRGPRFPLAMVPWLAFLGDEPHSALLCNAVLAKSQWRLAS